MIGLRSRLHPTVLLMASAHMMVDGYGNIFAPLLPLVRLGKLKPARIITHTLPLAEAPKGYAIFDRKEDRAIKVMLKP